MAASQSRAVCLAEEGVAEITGWAGRCKREAAELCSGQAPEEVVPLESGRTGRGSGRGQGPCQVLYGKELCHSSVSVWPQEAENKLMAMKP